MAKRFTSVLRRRTDLLTKAKQSKREKGAQAEVSMPLKYTKNYLV